ncbi:hypothetical protein [Bradyrhizobium sp. AUGA SZCCT0182]|uniref:hypothetical protein n=1 Tax=Bradyrhizobium sp. AUGA SZCCT0182 TaxID=2807667 RepID=UPI001BA8C505|nr:hypothetical protein [Bradyrhizobium sp. AUGA SZCCT0182]MBR1238139.1 hypothetical protein [Bradyrhizobium sp. AUGA SZCCT0182]
MQQRNKRRDLRATKPAVTDRLGLWFSTSRNVDGLWVGSWESEPHPGLRRVEEALRLIKERDPLHYSRVTSNLERIWVRLLPGDAAHYERSLKACVLDERRVLEETIEWIASTIIHEATHARLEHWGISYDENRRARIEAICLRRELNFVIKLPQTELLQEEIARTLEWCAGDHDYFSDASFAQQREQGQAEALRYLGAPDWLHGFMLKLRAVRLWVHQLRWTSRPQA